MGARDSGTGIELRKGAISETIRIVFQYQGKRCRESIRLPHTKTNIAYAKRLHSEVVNAIARGEFHYEDYFPNSRTAKALRKPIPVEPTPPAPVTVGDLLKDYLAIAKRKTIQLILTPMRNAIELGVTEEVLESNPFDSIKLGKLLPREQRISTFKADPFDIDEIESILAACNRAEDRNMFQFAFCTGMRPSEYVALQWQSVREDRHHIAVEGAFVDGQAKDTAKTPAGLRNIDSRRGALEALRAQHEHTGGQVGLVFVNPVTRRQWNGDKPIYKRWKQIVALSGVRFRNPYQTRHSFASNLLMLGANPLYVASQMGHADTTMVTRTYGKWVTAGLDDDRRERLLRLYQQSNPKRQDEFPRFD
jgi:integrase